MAGGWKELHAKVRVTVANAPPLYCVVRRAGGPEPSPMARRGVWCSSTCTWPQHVHVLVGDALVGDDGLGEELVGTSATAGGVGGALADGGGDDEGGTGCG